MASVARNQVRCSHRCTRRAAKAREGIKRRGGAIPQSAECGRCGATFKPTQITHRYCSLVCRSRAKDAHRRYRAHSKRSAVYERDRSICQLCGEPIDQAIPYPHPMAATLDHIVPVSVGGTHAVTNLQAAHMKCNASKGGGERWRMRAV